MAGSNSREVLDSLAAARNKIDEARRQAVAAMSERAALLNKIDCLEEKLAESENWEVEKQRYELQAAASGAFFYALKTRKPNEAAEALCAKCFQNGRKSVLQQIMPDTRTQGQATHQCRECLFEVVV